VVGPMELGYRFQKWLIPNRPRPVHMVFGQVSVPATPTAPSLDTLPLASVTRDGNMTFEQLCFLWEGTRSSIDVACSCMWLVILYADSALLCCVLLCSAMLCRAGQPLSPGQDESVAQLHARYVEALTALGKQHCVTLDIVE
jgi:hypothetical protein